MSDKYIEDAFGLVTLPKKVIADLMEERDKLYTQNGRMREVLSYYAQMSTCEFTPSIAETCLEEYASSGTITPRVESDNEA